MVVIGYYPVMKYEHLLLEFGPVLRQLREGEGLTQEQLAYRVGHNTPSYIGFLETGTRHPSLHMVLRLAHALGVKPSEMMAEMEKRQEE